MPKIEVWKCPHTGKLFEDEKPYRAHLRMLAKRRDKERAYQSITQEIRDVCHNVRFVNNMQELCEYIIEHQNQFILNALLGGFNKYPIVEALTKGWDIEYGKMTAIRLVTKWRFKCANTHSAPRDGVTNFGGNVPDAPLGYPGWYGRIISNTVEGTKGLIITRPRRKKKIEYSFPSMSDMFSGAFGFGKYKAGINTGSGGGGPVRNSYDVTIFQSDFPNMEKAVLFEMIANPDKKHETWQNGNDDSILDQMGKGEVGNTVGYLNRG